MMRPVSLSRMVEKHTYVIWGTRRKACRDGHAGW